MKEFRIEDDREFGAFLRLVEGHVDSEIESGGANPFHVRTTPLPAVEPAVAPLCIEELDRYGGGQ